MRYTQVTVFGGTGFIGRYVIDQLADQGFSIRVPTRSKSSAYFLRTAGSVGQVVPFSCDLNDDASLAKAVEGSRYVVNLIGVLTENRKQKFDDVHHKFAERLAKSATDAGVEKFVHISALGASKEDVSVYKKTKALGEDAVRANFPLATIIRPSIVFGAEDGFFNLFAKMAEISPVLPLIGGGETKFQPVYVDDIATAVSKILSDNQWQGKTFELGGRDVLTFKELLEQMMNVTGVKRKLVKIPFGLAKFQGSILQHLPGQVLTVDQVKSLETDNVLSGQYPGLHDLGIAPMTLDAILPSYLKRFRPGGRFAQRRVS